MITPTTNEIHLSTPATYDINTTVHIRGLFISNGSGYTDTTGILLSATEFASIKDLVNGDTLSVNYSFTLT